MLGGGGIGRPYRALAILLLPGALWVLRLASPAVPARSDDSAADRVNGRLVGLIVMFLFFYSGAEIGFGGWIYSYATALHLSSHTVAVYLTSAFWGSLAVGGLLAIPIAL